MLRTRSYIFSSLPEGAKRTGLSKYIRLKEKLPNAGTRPPIKCFHTVVLFGRVRQPFIINGDKKVSGLLDGLLQNLD